MIELFPNIDHVPLPGKALCPPEHIDAALAEVRTAFGQLTKNLNAADGVPLLLFERRCSSNSSDGGYGTRSVPATLEYADDS